MTKKQCDYNSSFLLDNRLKITKSQSGIAAGDFKSRNEKIHSFSPKFDFFWQKSLIYTGLIARMLIIN